MASAMFSKAIIEGLYARGLAPRDVSRITNLPMTKVRSILVGKERLTDRIMARIERETKTTVGQLAALSMGPHGGPLTELCDMWAQFAEAPQEVGARLHPKAVKSRVQSRRAG